MHTQAGKCVQRAALAASNGRRVVVVEVAWAMMHMHMGFDALASEYNAAAFDRSIGCLIETKAAFF